MSVTEYEKRFIELSRFVPDLVDTDAKKAKRFQRGLKPSLRSKVSAFELRSYLAVVQKAMVIKGDSDPTPLDQEGKKGKLKL